MNLPDPVNEILTLYKQKIEYLEREVKAIKDSITPKQKKQEK
jgi:hypothetical protein